MTRTGWGRGGIREIVMAHGGKMSTHPRALKKWSITIQSYGPFKMGMY